MESGRFATLILLVVLMIGGLGYYEHTRTIQLANAISTVQAKAENAELTADQAKATANEAKAAVAPLTADAGKAGDVGQLAKQATDAAAEAAKSAEEAKQAAEDVAEKTHAHRKG